MKKKWIIYFLIITTIIALLSGAVFITTQNIQSTIVVAIFLVIIFTVITCTIVQWREMLLLCVVLLIIGFFNTTAINTIVIGFFFNTVYLKLKYIPHQDSRIEKIEAYLNEHDIANKYSFNTKLFDKTNTRGQVLSSMLIQSLFVLPSVSIDALKKLKDDKYDIPFISEQKIYEKYLHLFKLSIESRTEYKRIALGLAFILFFLFMTLFIFMIIKEQKKLRKEIKDRWKRKDSYWEDGIKYLDKSDLIYIDTCSSDPNFIPAPSNGGKKCKWNGKKVKIESHCDECDFFLECYPECGIKENVNNS